MKIYIFGDSFSVDYDSNCLKRHNQKIEYLDWKGYTPKKYYHYLSEEYGFEIVNNSKCGIDNGFLFEIFTNLYPSIKKTDIVIFGWAPIERFSICNNIEPIIGDIEERWGASSSYIEFEWVKMAELNRNTTLYHNRHVKLIKFINQILENNKVIHWCWEDIKQEDTITWETNGEIIDYHYNEKKQIELYEILSKRLKSENQFTHNFWKSPNLKSKNLSIIKTT